jgi:hypothetical protein
VIATGLAADGRREVLGFEVGDSEDGAFWTAFLRSLKSRGLAGMQLVSSDAHSVLRAAIEAILIGASWQRCRVHFLRNVRPGPQGLSGDGRRGDPHIFAQPDIEWQVADKRYLSENHAGAAQCPRQFRAERCHPSGSHGIVKNRGASGVTARSTYTASRAQP